MMLRSLLLGTTLGLAACTSPATHYYTLLPTSESAPKVGAPADFQFELLTVRMPVQVDQPQLVVRQDQGRLAILDNERWGAPLADEFHDALAAQMERQLGVRDLAGLPKNAGQPVVSLQADVRRFDSVPGQYALVDVVWSLSRRGNDDSKRTTLTLRQRGQGERRGRSEQPGAGASESHRRSGSAHCRDGATVGR